jgi:hypothetical protein
VLEKENREMKGESERVKQVNYLEERPSV